MNNYNKEKFKQMLHYIIAEVGNKSNVGKVVLYKLLYFSDFDFYEKYETYLSGADYRAIQGGPAPLPFDEVAKELIKEKKIKHVPKSKDFKYMPEKYFSLLPPNTSQLSKEEVELIDKVLDKYSSFNGTSLSQLSHLDMPWKATDDKDIINYDLVFYRDCIFSNEEEVIENCIQ